ncbi:DUF4239 domain-containing protein [Polynucleobacter sp. MWH-P3-07-1]|uniref:bestrophin-like domain n=1 Tax=Polynucleobacter sp. MWH-P3-07-1 TaxID=1743173 RepID=UPI001BFDF3FA|nr:DUF4239 domain-containing protein [Polynucleobacter sp. MWH-P3-07-1]QWD83954.1 DUF4239 domain-containing protein [Polynucleobacter sp. MWH-P3-07-1]
MHLFIFNLSEIALLIILLFVSIGSSLACFFLVQKYCTWLSLRDGGIFGTIFANTMPTLVGFIFAFVTVAAWQNHNAINDSVSKEAHTLFDLYQTLGAYPSETQKIGQEEIIKYSKLVINQEWPTLGQTGFDIETFKQLDRINSLFLNYKPANVSGFALHNEGLRLLSSYRDLRRTRVENANSYIQKPMWGALVVSALFLILFSAFFKTRNIRIHAVMMALVGGSLGVMFFLLTLLDNPFLGPSAIQPIPFEKTLESILIIQK